MYINWIEKRQSTRNTGVRREWEFYKRLQFVE